MKPRDIFLAALRRQPTLRVSTGSATSVATADLMTEAGAGFPEAHVNAEAMAQLAGAGHTLLGFDNVMPLFSVWHESAALGCRVQWGDPMHMPDGQAMCASIREEVRIPADLLLRPPCAVPLEALRLLKKRLGHDAAVVGKVFGPWTLGYHVFGIEPFLMATLDEPDAVKRAMRRLMDVTVTFAQAQIDSGADAITLGDHCTRDLCSPAAYREFLAEMHAELHERIGCPLILHICGDTSDRIESIRGTGIECFHFDSKVPAGEARRLAGGQLSLMGGTSNLRVVRGAAIPISDTIERDIREKLAAGIDIVGPECAVPLDAPSENLKMIARVSKKLGVHVQ